MRPHFTLAPLLLAAAAASVAGMAIPEPLLKKAPFNATAATLAWNDTLQAKLAAMNATWSPKLAAANASVAPKLATLRAPFAPALAALNDTLAPKLAALNDTLAPKMAELNATLAPKAADAAAKFAAAASAATAAHPALADLNATLAAKGAVLKSAAATLKAKKRGHGDPPLCVPNPAGVWASGVAATNTYFTNFKTGGSSIYVSSASPTQDSWKIYVLTAPADLCGGAAVGATARLSTATLAFAFNTANVVPTSVTANVRAALFATNATAGPVGAPAALSPPTSVTIPKCLAAEPAYPPASPCKPIYALDLGTDLVIQPGQTFAFGVISDWANTNWFKWANVQVGTGNPAVTGPVAGAAGFAVSPLAYTGAVGSFASTNAINNFLELSYTCSGGCTPL